jgi:hypothetical protein
MSPVRRNLPFAASKAASTWLDPDGISAIHADRHAAASLARTSSTQPGASIFSNRRSAR